MGRYLQAIKNEARKQLPAVIRGEERRDPPVQPSYEEYRPPQSYGSPASSDLSPEQLQMIIAHARLQGAREEIEKSRAELHAAHHAGAERIHSLALAAINKKTDPVEIRYRGSAHDKKERRFAELKFATLIAAIILALILIFWVKDQVNSYADGWNHPPTVTQHKHYERHESWDDR